MANIATYLARIKNAILGEEVRDSIHDSIAAINQDVGTANTNASNAVSTANSASTAASQAVSTANAASAASSQAVETANAAKEESSTASENAQTALDNSQAAKDAAAAANTAAGKANEATTAANAAAENANAKATAAETATSSANTAADAANKAAENLTTIISEAENATEAANTAAETAESKATEATTAATQATAAATKATEATTAATQATEAATKATGEANTATESANEAADAANEAAANAKPTVFGSFDTFPKPGNANQLYVDSSSDPRSIYTWNEENSEYVLTGGAGPEWFERVETNESSIKSLDTRISKTESDITQLNTSRKNESFTLTMTDLCDKITQNCFFNPLTNTVHITVELHVKETIESTTSEKAMAIIPEKYRPKENKISYCFLNFKDGSVRVSGLGRVSANGEISQYSTSMPLGYVFFVANYIID